MKTIPTTHETIATLNTFFNIFSLDPKEVFSFTVMDKHSKGVVPGLGILFASVDQLFEAQGIVGNTLHTTLCQTDLRGKKLKNIIRPYVWCVDIDTFTTDEVIKTLIRDYTPHMVVESSRNAEGLSKYHLYWRCAEEVTVDEWSKYQAGMAKILGGDTELSVPSHAIRVPGFERYMKDGEVFTPDIVHVEPESSPLGVADIKARFEGIDDVAVAFKKREKKDTSAIKKLVQKGTQIRSEDVSDSVSKVGRNKTLFKFGISYLYRKDNPSTEEICGYCELINGLFKTPLERDEFEKTVQSILGYLPQRDKRQAELEAKIEVIESEAKLSAPEFPYDYTVPDLQGNRFTDFAVLERFYQRFGDRLVRNHAGVWCFSEKERIWKLQAHGDSTELKHLYNFIIEDILVDERFIPELCLNGNGERSMSKELKAREKFKGERLWGAFARMVLNATDKRVSAIEMHEFDPNPNLLLVKNGLLDLRDGSLRAPEASDYVMGRSPKVIYDPGAKCPGWIQFLEEVFQLEEDIPGVIRFMKQLFGYSLSAHINARKIFCHYGTGANGKSKVLSALNMLGGNLSTYVDPDDFSKIQGANGKAFERFGAKAQGRRVVIVDDLETKTVWNESLIKALTAPIFRARGEYEKSREVKNSASVHLGLNTAPAPEAQNFGILSRLCFIPYNMQFEVDGKASDRIDAMIEEELSGILNWALEGFQEWYKDKTFYTPASFDEALEEYKEEHFTLENIIREMFVRGEGEDFIYYRELEGLVNKYMQNQGISKRVSQEEIVQSIKKIYKLIPSKKWYQNTKQCLRGFKLKYVIEENDVKNLLKNT